MMKTTRLLVGLYVAVALLGLTTSSAFCKVNLHAEESMGREYAAELEKAVKVVTDEAIVSRVDSIGQAIAKIANEYQVKAGYGSEEILKFKYQFKVIEDKDVNAMSLPGGIVYVNTGLLDLVQSDDELAGVLAHEVAHAAHHHMSYLLNKQSSIDRYVALIALAGILGNAKGRDLNNMLMGAQMMRTGKLSGYTQEAEKDADRTAVSYLARSQYKPEGMLEFMKKLENKRTDNPSAPLGIFQTHPASYRRVVAITQAMRKEGFSPNIRKFQDIAYAKAEQVAGDNELFQVVVGKAVVCVPSSLNQGSSSKERAELIAGNINSLLDKGLVSADISEDMSKSSLLAKGSEILNISAEDAKTSGESQTTLLNKARKALQHAVWADWLAAKAEDVREECLKD